MEEKEAPEPSDNAESHGKREFSELDDYLPGVPGLGIYSLPENLRHIVLDYISDDTGDVTRLFLLGEQHITLFLSQRHDLELGASWHFGCLSHEDRWKTTKNVGIDKNFLITDYDSCLWYLDGEDSAHCPIVIKVLVIQIDLSSKDFSNCLDDLEYTLAMLQKYLKRVQHVVFAVTTYGFCCFSFKDVFDNATGLPQRVKQLLALKQILADLRACWEINHTLNTLLLLDYYIFKDDKPKSDKYLSKFVISLNHFHDGDFFKAVDPTRTSSKLQWIYYLENSADFRHGSLKHVPHCHSIYLKASNDADAEYVNYRLRSEFSFEDIPFVERIVLNSNKVGFPLTLPRPSALLTDATPQSALIELSLTGDDNAFDLSHLNSGYFPNLTHFSLLRGKMTGHLDSQNVPRLKTLIIELGTDDNLPAANVCFLVQERVQLLINTGRPWQLVATTEKSGWSLASYDETTPNPHDDAKEEFPPSHPFIHELLLFMRSQKHADEWQAQLSGEPLVKAAVRNHNDGVLVWAPDRVQRISVYGTTHQGAQFTFEKIIVGQTRILTSLEFYYVSSVIHGESVPHLELLEIYHARVTLSGAFPRLKRLSLRNIHLIKPWELNAPSLMYLKCFRIFRGSGFSFRPKSLPHLSYLEIALYGDVSVHCPVILLDGDNLGLSRVKDVVLEKRFISSPFFDQCRVNDVLHLALSLDPAKLPACWFDSVWLCQTLTIDASVPLIEDSKSQESLITTTLLPPLPRVKKLTVMDSDCHILLSREMPNLTECTVPSPRSLGVNLFCPALQRISFTENLTDFEKHLCLDRATYVAIGAQPSWVYIIDDREAKQMSWDMAPSATSVSFFTRPFEAGDNSFVSVE